MRRGAITILGLLIAWMAAASPARAQPLVTDLSKYHVAITSSFTGTDIMLFGALGDDFDGLGERKPELVAVVRGPAQAPTIRRKDRVMGVWANVETATFQNVPSYYWVASTKPLADIAGVPVLDRYQIGIRQLKLEPKGAKPGDPALQPFRDALIRIKEEQGLFREETGGFTFMGNRLFRTSIAIPANVPIGDYKVEAYLFVGGQIISAQSSPLFIGKTGFERQVNRFAVQNSFIYGALAVLMTVLAGWASALIFRKD